MDNVNITISSYGFLINFYPIYDKLHPSIRTPQYGLFATLVALLFTAFTYVSFAWLAIKCFGMNNIDQNIFVNFDSNADDWVSSVAKLLFLMIFLCALPFNIHPLKVCTLNFVEELRAQTVSKQIDG